MKTKTKSFLLLALLLIMGISLVSAHVEHAAPAVEETSILYQIFLLHDWIHPIFFILMVYSCYYFRFFFGRNISHEPRYCLGNDCSGCYKAEGPLKQYHRYFFWGTLLLTFIHLGEIFPSISNFPVFLSSDYWILISETTYLGLAFLFLGTCYHFRYFAERLAKKKIISYKLYNGLTSLNRHHNLFFWLTITAALTRFILVAIDTGSIIEAIPGTF